MIHGFIDGYSRLITGLRASDNNLGKTVLNLFLNASQLYGVPSRVRGDHGVENILLAAWMELHRGERRGSYIWGRYLKLYIYIDIWFLEIANAIHLLTIEVYTMFGSNDFGSTSQLKSGQIGQNYSLS